jgi:hypothetical protein
VLSWIVEEGWVSENEVFGSDDGNKLEFHSLMFKLRSESWSGVFACDSLLENDSGASFGAEMQVDV